MTRKSFAAAATALLFGLAACGGPGPQAPSAEVAPQNPIDRAISALDRGDEESAQKLLRPFLKREPGNPEAAVLMASIQQDPVALLGPKNYPYKTEPGDTMIGLSKRFLGNRLKFYELSRYNGLKVPNQLVAGTILKIPGEPPRPPVSAEPAPAPRPAPPKPRRGRAQAGAAAPAPAAPPMPAPAAAGASRLPPANPAAAMRLRGAALGALNQGKADQAVTLLRRAAALAPDNALIARDLARAQRIAQTVHSAH